VLGAELILVSWLQPAGDPVINLEVCCHYFPPGWHLHFTFWGKEHHCPLAGTTL